MCRHEIDPRCLGVDAQVRTALGSDGGVADGIAMVQGHVQGVLMQEEAAAALSRGEAGHRCPAICKAAGAEGCMLAPLHSQLGSPLRIAT